jgi:hypothetical protein
MHELRKHRRMHGSSSFTVRLFINPPFLQCSKCSMEYNTMHKLRKQHHRVCTVHHHLQCAPLFINPPFLQCSKCSMEYNTMHELRKHRRVYGSSSFTVRLLFINPLLYSAPSAAWSTTQCTSCESTAICACMSFTVPLFINPPFLQCSKCSMENNTMHELRKHCHLCTYVIYSAPVY